MKEAQCRVHGGQADDRRPGDPQQAPHQDVLDRLAAARRAVRHQNRRRRRDDVDDADDRLLRHPPPLVGTGEREDAGTERGEAERVEEGDAGIGLTPRQDRHRAAERRHLGERKVHEDHFPRDHVQPEIRVNRDDDEARHEGRQKEAEVHHLAPVLTATSLKAAARLVTQVFIRSK